MPFFSFFDYNKAGKGVAKNEPEKKRFFKFWELFSRKFWKFFYINLIYALFCSPLIIAFIMAVFTVNNSYWIIAVPGVITFGPATVGMTQVMRKFVIEQPIFIFDEFFSSFKKNFKQGLIIGIFDVVFIFCFVIAYLYYDWLTILQPTFHNIALMSATIAAGAMIWIMHFYIYPQITTLSLSMYKIIKNSILFTVLGLRGNIVTLIVCILLVAGMVITMPYSVFFIPVIPFAWMSFLMVFNAYPVIQKYIITPFYEARGEKNPEIPDYSDKEDENEALFEDFGGREAEIKPKPKLKGKIIR